MIICAILEGHAWKREYESQHKVVGQGQNCSLLQPQILRGKNGNKSHWQFLLQATKEPSETKLQKIELSSKLQKPRADKILFLKRNFRYFDISSVYFSCLNSKGRARASSVYSVGPMRGSKLNVKNNLFLIHKPIRFRRS